MNIYYVKLVEDDDWYDSGPKDNRFFAFRTHAQVFADELNQAELEKYNEHKERAMERWAVTESLVKQIKDAIGIDITPLIPGHSAEFNYLPSWGDSYEVVEAPVE